MRQEINPPTLPEATGGTGALTYSLALLPVSIFFDPATRTVSGALAHSGTLDNATVKLKITGLSPGLLMRRGCAPETPKGMDHGRCPPPRRPECQRILIIVEKTRRLPCAVVN